MFTLVKSDVKPLTRELAQSFRDMEPAPVERELDPKRVKYLRGKAADGHLITFHWSTVNYQGRSLRMNGQHSSTMLTELDGMFPEGLTVHLDEYSAESEDGLTELFRQFDDRRSGRTAGDVSGAYQMLIPGLRNVPKPIAKIGVEGITWQRANIEGIFVPHGDDRYRVFNEDGVVPYLQWLGQLFSIKTPELRKIPVVAAMYGTFKANPTEARTFWEQVARGGIEHEDNAPSSMLDAWLRLQKEEKPEGLKPGNIWQGCVYAWNSYREGRSLRDIRYNTTKGMASPIE